MIKKISFHKVIQKVCVFFIVFVLLTFNSVAQAYTFKLKDEGAGYCYRIGLQCFAEFTQDENGILPKDKTLAEVRFARRREFVELWYERNRPLDLPPRNMAVEFMKALVLLPVGPVLFIAEGFSHNHQEAPEETAIIEKRRKEHELKLQELRDYIVDDCRSEKEIEAHKSLYKNL